MVTIIAEFRIYSGVSMTRYLTICTILVVIIFSSVPSFSYQESSQVYFYVINSTKNKSAFKITIFKESGLYVTQIATDEEGKSSVELAVGKYYFVVYGNDFITTMKNYYVGGQNEKSIIINVPEKKFWQSIFDKDFNNIMKGAFLTLFITFILFIIKLWNFKRTINVLFASRIITELISIDNKLSEMKNIKTVPTKVEANLINQFFIERIKLLRKAIDDIESKYSNMIFEYSQSTARKLFTYKEIVVAISNELIFAGIDESQIRNAINNIRERLILPNNDTDPLIVILRKLKKITMA
jgi:hypothetical protein